ncbi:MAG: hypothetical protein IJP85_05840 [Synergistaceae bacterium]|nr:hypothetical protein [Synergistaceae bacterium]
MYRSINRQEMIHIEDKLCIWQGYKERAQKFWSDVEDDLHYKFNPHFSYDEDTDTPNVRKLFNMLCDVAEFIEAHTDELEKEFEPYDQNLCLEVNS